MGPGFRAGSGLFLVLLVAASGCTAPGTGLYSGPTAVPAGAPNEIGDGDFPLRVKVVQEHGGGPHIVGAPIVVFHIDKPHDAPAAHLLARTNATLGGRTGADGVLIVHVNKGQTYSFATSVPNWTAETRHLVKVTDEFRTKPLLITVFKTNGTYEVAGKLPLTVRAEVPFLYFNGGTVRWWAKEVKLHENNASGRQYLYRIRQIDAVLTYTEPVGYAELGLRVGLAGEGGQPVYWDRDYNGGILSAPGAPGEERFTLGAADLAIIGTLKNPVLKVGPFSHEYVVTPECIPWTIRLEILYDTSPMPPPRKPFIFYGSADDDVAKGPITC